MHSGEHWYPNWQLSINDRCTHPRVTQEWVMFFNLLRDAEFTEKLTPPELAIASSTAFVADTTRRYSDLLEK